MATETDLKWKLPGWRIESKYTNNVLIGNWDEERRKVGCQFDIFIFNCNISRQFSPHYGNLLCQFNL